MRYDELFDHVIEAISREHQCLPYSDGRIAEILTEQLETDVCKKWVFNCRHDADIPGKHVRKWLWRHDISPIQVSKVNGNKKTAK